MIVFYRNDKIKKKNLNNLTNFKNIFRNKNRKLFYYIIWQFNIGIQFDGFEFHSQTILYVMVLVKAWPLNSIVHLDSIDSIDKWVKIE